MKNSNKIVEKAKKILEEEGSSFEKDLSPLETINKYLVPGIEVSKDTLAVLYDYKPRDKSGIIGKIKNFILTKVRNIALATMEKPAIRQQKYNDLVFQYIQNLKLEIEELKKTSK